MRTEDGVKAVFDKVLEDECHGCQHVVAALRGNTCWWEVVTAGLIPQDLYLSALVVCSCSVLKCIAFQTYHILHIVQMLH